MKKAIVLLVLLAAFSGCATYKPRSLPNLFVLGEVNTIKKDDVSVSAKFLDCDESIKYFDCKTCERKIQIVLVIISNKSENNYGFRESDVIPESIGADKAGGKCARSIVCNGGLFPPALVRHCKINREIKADFLSKEIKDSQIKPKEELSGALFFNQINKGEKIGISVFNIDTGEKLLFEFSKN